MMDELPAQMIVDSLRNEVARLNDERLTLQIKLEHSYRIIASYQQAEENAAPATEEPEVL